MIKYLLATILVLALSTTSFAQTFVYQNRMPNPPTPHSTNAYHGRVPHTVHPYYMTPRYYYPQYRHHDRNPYIMSPYRGYSYRGGSHGFYFYYRF